MGLWSSAILHGLRTDRAAAALALVGDQMVAASEWTIEAGRVRIPGAASRCWSGDAAGSPGEVTVTRADGRAGLWVAGWWTADSQDLQMCVAGLELWDARRRMMTEDPTAIAALGFAGGDRRGMRRRGV
jgi:hypothetical protein